MKRHRHTPEQIVRKLREGERLLNEGRDITEVVRHLEIAESTWNRWRSQYGRHEGRRGQAPCANWSRRTPG
jgi:transposase-like protein